MRSALITIFMAFQVLCIGGMLGCGSDDDDSNDDDSSDDADDDTNDITDDDSIGDDDEADDDSADDDDDVVDDDADDDADDDSDDDSDDDADDDAEDNYALRFDGVNDFVVLGTGNWIVDESYTLEAWVKLDSPSAYAAVVGAYDQPPYHHDFSIHFHSPANGSRVVGGHWDGDLDYVVGTSDCSDMGSYTHIAVSYDHSVASGEIYLDGVREGVASFSTGPGQGGTLIVYAGANESAGEGFFEGTIDEIRISDAARYTGTLISPERHLPMDAHTLGLWRFDEGNGNATEDATGNHADAEIFGAAWELVE